MQVTNGQTDEPKKKTERDLEIELEEDYHLDLRKTWSLKNNDERYDVLPEIRLNKNIADFIDPENKHDFMILTKVKMMKKQQPYEN
jgi:nucleolar GTP-binding protein